MTFALRWYQEKAINDLRVSLRGNQASLLVMPTGSGKTLTVGQMLYNASARRKRSIFAVHRQELLHQTMKSFASLGIEFGVIAAGHREFPTKCVQIAMIDTLRRRLHKIEPPDFFVADEAHHAVSQTWSSVFHAFSQSKSVGLTATAIRLDGKGLGKHFQKIVQGPSPSQLIEEGYLSPYVAYGMDIGDIGDATPSITGNIVDTYQEKMPGKRAIGFAPSIAYSKAVVSAFNAKGIPAAHVDGDTREDIRIRAMNMFRENKLKVLFNVALFGEGVHVEGIDGVIDACPTESLAAFLQRFGRCMAPFYAPGMPLDTPEQRRAAIAAGPKPHAIYIDHASNITKSGEKGFGHGLPDEDREWSLDDKISKRTNQAATQVRKCPKCYHDHRPAPQCPACGHVYLITPREVEERDGELVELDKDAIKRRRREEEWHAKTLEEMTALGVARGYQNPAGWAWHRLKARQRRHA